MSDPFSPGALSGYPRGKATASGVALLDRADTGCYPLKVAGSDGNVYFAKYPNNPHGWESLLAERVVAAAGEYLDAPLPPSRLISIPTAWENPRWLQAGHPPIHAGIAHASQLVEHEIIEGDSELEHVNRDGNPRRAPAFIALWEWCFGEDPQWLYALGDDKQMWTFDHGLWLGGGGEWTPSDLHNSTHIRNRWTGSFKHMDGPTFLDLAERVVQCRPEDTLRMVATTPVDWGFTEEDLITVARWLYDRREFVAADLRRHAGQVAG